MYRRALIISCDSTPSGALVGTKQDNENVVSFLKSNMGGDWLDPEIISLHNPTINQVKLQSLAHFILADYGVTVFSGHGYLDGNRNNLQMLELMDGDISIIELRNISPKQTMIIDACSKIYKPTAFKFSESLRATNKALTDSGFTQSTRTIFETALNRCEDGITILSAAGINESARTTNDGGAYILSLLASVEIWGRTDKRNIELPLNIAHQLAIPYMKDNFPTNQNPYIYPEKRHSYYPLGIKFAQLDG